MSRPLQPISFNHLLAGSYNPQVQASIDGNDLAIRHQQEISVSILWQSRWAYGFYALLMAGLLLLTGRGLQLCRQRDQSR